MSAKQYDEVCRDEFAGINRKLDTITKKLYEDNGGESIQSRLNRIDMRNNFRDKIIAMLVAGVFIPLCYHIVLSLYTALAQP